MQGDACRCDDCFCFFFFFDNFEVADGKGFCVGVDDGYFRSCCSDIFDARAQVCGKEEMFGCDGVCRIENRAVGQAPKKCDVVKPHLGWSVLADGCAAVRADAGESCFGEGCHAELVVRAGKECGKGGCVDMLSFDAHAEGHADHVLFGNVCFDEVFGFCVGEVLCERRVLDFCVGCDKQGIMLCEFCEGKAVCFPSGNEVSKGVSMGL